MRQKLYRRVETVLWVSVRKLRSVSKPLSYKNNRYLGPPGTNHAIMGRIYFLLQAVRTPFKPPLGFVINASSLLTFVG